MLRIGTIVVIFVLGGCASMSKEACVTADWQAIGYEDGARGAPVSAVTPRRQTCAKKAGVTVDMTAYMSGRDQGLEEFCRPSNGYAVGVRGGAYHGVCTGPEEGAFITAYQTGNQLYVLERAVYNADAEIATAHHDLDAVEHDIAHTEAALISVTTPMLERVDLLVQLKQYSEAKGNIETSLIVLAENRGRAQEELADYRAFLAVNGPYPSAMQPTNASY